MKALIFSAFLGLITKEEVVKAITLNKLSENICISEIGDDTNELLGIDNNYELIELDESPEKIEADMKKADEKAHEAHEKAEHEAEAKAKADEA